VRYLHITRMKMDFFIERNRISHTMEFIVNQDIRSIQTKRYTEDREHRYRRNFKAIRCFFNSFHGV
jgi:hypothetical protein